MMQLITQMIKLPLAAFVYGMEMLVKTMRGMQKMADQGVDAIVSGTARSPDPSPEGKSDPESDATISLSGGASLQTTDQEERKMADQNWGKDQDLSGDDLKYVSFTVVFTKPDLEATLAQQKDDLVNYSTDGASYGGIKISHFFGDVAAHKVSRPQIWKDNSYPPGAKGDTDWELPIEDERYVTFVYWVERRIGKNEADYDKEQVIVLREIRDKLGPKPVAK